MVHSSRFFAILLANTGLAAAQPTQPETLSEIDNTNNDDCCNLCCQLVKAGLEDLLLTPDAEEYADRQASYWAPNAALGPQCILTPLTTDDVSRSVKTVAKLGANFAIRSGGHVQWAGGSDIQDGVTIDLGLMKDVTYDEHTTIATIQPGPRWGDVFAFLEPYGVAPTGGRDANVGIGGFLTGGGNAYLTARNGFGCDTVVNFEVVLADGSVINANKTSNDDLWKALKGGWANYGVVSRFDIETTPARQVWGSNQIHDGSVGDLAAEGLVKFTDEYETYPAAAHLVLRTYNAVAPENIGMVTVLVDTEAEEQPPIFDDIAAIPANVTTPGLTTLGELAEGGIDPSDDRVHWFTLTFNNDVEIVKKAMALHDELVADLKTTFGSPSAFSTQCVLQPVPSFFGDIGASKGGNMLGLDAVKTNSILWLGTVAYEDPAFDDITHEKLERSFQELEKFAQSRDGNVAWRYINYSDKTQNPLKSYGEENLAFMNQVAAKYDPEGVFQKQVPGSFKLPEA